MLVFSLPTVILCCKDILPIKNMLCGDYIKNLRNVNNYIDYFLASTLQP